MILKLESFLKAVDEYQTSKQDPNLSEYNSLISLTRKVSTVRRILGALQIDIYSYTKKNSNETEAHDEFEDLVNRLKVSSIQALGILDDYDEIEEKLNPDAPAITADRLHPWVWESAKPSWKSGLYRAAVHHAASAINEQLQRKLGRSDIADDKIVSEAFRAGEATAERPKLTIAGDQNDLTVQSIHRGALQLGQGCFWAIRNPAAHETKEWEQQVSLERLAALSVFARLIEDAEVTRE